MLIIVAGESLLLPGICRKELWDITNQGGSFKDFLKIPP